MQAINGATRSLVSSTTSTFPVGETFPVATASQPTQRADSQPGSGSPVQPWNPSSRVREPVAPTPWSAACARAPAPRCGSPPESGCGRLWSLVESAVRRRMSGTLSRISRRPPPVTCSAYATFS